MERLIPGLKVWLLASRPKTLPAAAAPVILGTALAISDQSFKLFPALAALIGALLIQIGANLANDVFDYQKGADTSERLGPLRVTQAGLLSPHQVKWGMGLVFALAVIVGVYLVFIGGWPIVIIGILSIISAIAYTGGPYPLGYNGLGDLFVFVFFGLIAVCGTYYVQVLKVTMDTILASISIGVLATAILVVNNLRDIETDKKAGKKTLAVRLGERGAIAQYVILLIIAYLIPISFWIFDLASGWVLITCLTLPFAVRLTKILSAEKGRVLNKALSGTGQLELYFAVLFAIGLILK